MKNLVRIVRKMSFVLDFITDDMAREIILDFNKKFGEVTGAGVVEVRLMERGAGGVTFYSIGCFNTIGSPSPKLFIIPENTENLESTGIWTWIYEHKKSVWIETHDRNEDGSLTNKITGEKIHSRYLDIHTNTAALIATPMKFNEDFCGIYSVEASSSDKLNEETLEMMQDIAKSFASILKKAKAQEHKREDTKQATRLLRESINQLSCETYLNDFRCGFLARPFEDQFDEFSKSVATFMRGHQILLEHYKPVSSKNVVIDEIKGKIEQSHFCLVDITEQRPNVLLELGMIMMLNKELLIFQREGDDEIPFDLRPYQCYNYRIVPRGQVSPVGVEICDPATGRYTEMDHMLTPFLEKLYLENSFREAKPWPGSSSNDF